MNENDKKHIAQSMAQAQDTESVFGGLSKDQVNKVSFDNIGLLFKK